MPSEMGLSPLVGLLQSLQILKVVSLAHPLKTDKIISMGGLKCGDGGGEIAKTPIFNNNKKTFFSYLEKAMAVKISSYPNHFVPLTQININNC